MLTKAQVLIAFVAVSIPLIGTAQQSPSPQPTQTQTSPCSTATQQNNKPTNTFADRLKKVINDKGTKLATRTGIPMPTTDDAAGLIGTKTAPCPPKAAAPAQPAAAPQQATLKLPQDSLLTIKCNPSVAAKGPNPATFALPDPNAFEMPGKSNAWEADSVVPDLSAKQPCYAFKVDPTNHKYFLPQ